MPVPVPLLPLQQFYDSLSVRRQFACMSAVRSVVSNSVIGVASIYIHNYSWGSSKMTNNNSTLLQMAFITDLILLRKTLNKDALFVELLKIENVRLKFKFTIRARRINLYLICISENNFNRIYLTQHSYKCVRKFGIFIIQYFSNI